MAKSRRVVHAAAQETLTPPDELTDSQTIAKVVKADGNNLYTCELPNKKTFLFELESRFRNAIFIKRGGYVLVDVASSEERPAGSKVVGEIINVVRDEKLWRKQPYWPAKFVKKTYDDSEDEDESNVGKMPPSDSEDDDEMP